MHLRTPGREDEETIASGDCGGRGGWLLRDSRDAEHRARSSTTPDVLRGLRARARVGGARSGRVLRRDHEGPGRGGAGELGALADAGAVGFTDDGRPVAAAGVMRRALQYNAITGRTIAVHCEEHTLTRGGHVHAGAVAAELGLGGWPSLGESLMVARDVDLAGDTGQSLHLMHLSARESVDHLRRGRQAGVCVTGEVTPHHLCLTDDAVRTLDPNLKMNPPLRTSDDRAALIDALRDGTISAVATDHAPHSLEEKEVPFESAPFGVLGLETAFSALYTYLVEPGVLSLETVLERMSAGPAVIFGLERPRIALGAIANLTLLDLAGSWRVRADRLPVAVAELVAARRAPQRAGRADDRRRQDRVRMNAALILEDGAVFAGESVGADGFAFGEAVFTTSMTGYQEVATDPSFEGQIVCFTAPMVGNYGVDERRSESRRTHATAVVMREARGPEWTDWLHDQGVVALTGVDTRSLVLHLREAGAMRAAAVAGDHDPDEVLRAVREQPAMAGAALVAQVSTSDPYSFSDSGDVRIAVVDFGCKRSILRRLETSGAAVDVFPHDVDADTLAGYEGVLLSPGPGDPAPLGDETRMLEDLLGRVPVLGVCLGHQLLALATGKETFKLPFGHRGANHPVLDHRTRKVLVTSQNHGFAVASGDESGVTHSSLYDGTVEGLDYPELRARSAQFHPEASPGPHDAATIISGFVEELKAVA